MKVLTVQVRSRLISAVYALRGSLPALWKASLLALVTGKCSMFKSSTGDLIFSFLVFISVVICILRNLSITLK
jgi:hypothetical protein